jgi:hypothetical protein
MFMKTSNYLQKTSPLESVTVLSSLKKHYLHFAHVSDFVLWGFTFLWNCLEQGTMHSPASRSLHFHLPRFHGWSCKHIQLHYCNFLTRNAKHMIWKVLVSLPEKVDPTGTPSTIRRHSPSPPFHLLLILLWKSGSGIPFLFSESLGFMDFGHHI